MPSPNPSTHTWNAAQYSCFEFQQVNWQQLARGQRSKEQVSRHSRAPSPSEKQPSVPSLGYEHALYVLYGVTNRPGSCQGPCELLWNYQELHCIYWYSIALGSKTWCWGILASMLGFLCQGLVVWRFLGTFPSLNVDLSHAVGNEEEMVPITSPQPQPSYPISFPT